MEKKKKDEDAGNKKMEIHSKPIFSFLQMFLPVIV